MTPTGRDPVPAPGRAGAWRRSWQKWWREISLASKLGLFLAFAILTVTSLVAVFQALQTRSNLLEVSVTRNKLRFLSRLDPLERSLWHLDSPLAESLLKSSMEGEETIRIVLFEPSGGFSIAVERAGVQGSPLRVVNESSLQLTDLVPAAQVQELSRRGEGLAHREPMQILGLGEADLVRLATPLFHRFDETGEVLLIGYVVQDFSMLPLRENIRSAVSGVVAVYICVALLIFAGTFLVVRRALLLPLSRLALASLDASRGVFNPVRITSGQDELGVLQRNFNTLMEETRRQFETYEWLGFEAYRIARSESLFLLREQVRVSLSRFAPRNAAFDLLFSEECFSLVSQAGVFVRLDDEGLLVEEERYSAPQILRTFPLALPVDPSHERLPKAYIVSRDFPFEDVLPFSRRVSSLAAACGHGINTLLLQVALTRIDSQRNELQTLLASVPVGILLLDARLVIQREFSRAASQLLGVAHPAGLPFDETFLRHFVPAAEYERTRAALRSVFGRTRGEGVSLSAELPASLRRIGPQGEVTLIEAQWVPVWNLENRLEKILVTLRDVSELEMSRARLTQKSRLASLGQMAGGIAHEINNPLAVIQGYAMTLRQLVEEGRSGSLDTPRLVHVAGRIEATVERAARIVRSLRTFARDAENDPVVDYPLARLLEEVLEFSRERFRSQNVALECDSVAADATMPCRPIEIGQVILNLLNNAFDALQGIPQGEGHVRIGVEWTKRHVQVKVCDNGPGIPLEQLEQIFYPFFTTKEVGKGTGLGLPISLQIMRAHGGRLFHQTEHGETCFVLELPVDRSEVEMAHGPRSANDPAVPSTTPAPAAPTARSEKVSHPDASPV